MKTSRVLVYAVVSKFLYVYAKLLPLWGLGDANFHMSLGAWEGYSVWWSPRDFIAKESNFIHELSTFLLENKQFSCIVCVFFLFWKIYRRLCNILQVLVVANPANTNALILKEFAPSIPERNISCLTRLDHNRALGQISERLNVQVSDVKNVIIWGNHSSTQYPDVNHATVNTPAGEKPVRQLVSDDAWYITNTLNSLPPFIFRRFVGIYT